ncbi:hypothetical protein THICB2_50047 [Thiomonas sp. CB2]|nr:hypothetical protein THICB2_50047 [Thiomonas sp. CB2]VDY10591.1 protein of unknown function [Thiomonas sp. Sup16B3]
MLQRGKRGGVLFKDSVMGLNLD